MSVWQLVMQVPPQSWLQTVKLKFSELVSHYFFLQPTALDSVDPINESACDFQSDLVQLISAISGGTSEVKQLFC